MVETDAQGVRSDSPHPVPDLNPFVIEPLILARLHRANVPPAVAGIAAGVITLLTVTWTALISNLFYANAKSGTWWRNLWLFILHNPSTAHGHTVPYLEDYPSMLLTVTIGTSVYLVYGIFRMAAVLHSDMEHAGCIRTTKDGQAALTAAVKAINVKFVQWGKFAPIAAILSLASSTVLDFRLEGRLFTLLGAGNLYRGWWASLDPFRAGGLIWILFGALGIYMVYAESVLGLTYVKFLRTCRNDYQFRANMLNPDGLFGWTRIRQIVSNLEAGVLCTMLTSWALSFFLQPALGSVITVAVLALFNGVVLYVFVNVTWNFRRQVRTDRDFQRAEVGRQIADNRDGPEATRLLRTLVAYRRLELISSIPSVPIRPRWLIAGAVTILFPLAALILQLLSYFSGK